MLRRLRRRLLIRVTVLEGQRETKRPEQRKTTKGEQNVAFDEFGSNRSLVCNNTVTLGTRPSPKTSKAASETGAASRLASASIPSNVRVKTKSVSLGYSCGYPLFLLWIHGLI